MWETIDNLSGVAALVNGLLLWPIVKSLKKVTDDHRKDIQALKRKRHK